MSHAVLIIEDEEILAKNIRLYLARHGYEARAVGSGEEGLAALDSFNPDLVLLDFQLPGMDGLEILRRIRTGLPAGLQELAQLGRSLWSRRADILAYFDTGVSNGPVEAINGRL